MKKILYFLEGGKKKKSYNYARKNSNQSDFSKLKAEKSLYKIILYYLFIFNI